MVKQIGSQEVSGLRGLDYRIRPPTFDRYQTAEYHETKLESLLRASLGKPQSQLQEIARVAKTPEGSLYGGALRQHERLADDIGLRHSRPVIPFRAHQTKGSPFLEHSSGRATQKTRLADPAMGRVMVQQNTAFNRF
jgi:hypothetical protein